MRQNILVVEFSAVFDCVQSMLTTKSEVQQVAPALERSTDRTVVLRDLWSNMPLSRVYLQASNTAVAC